MIFSKALLRRKYALLLVPDPEDPKKKISKRVVLERGLDRLQVSNTENPGKVAKGTLRMRKYDRKLVQDPKNLEEQISQSKLRHRKSNRQQMPAPEIRKRHSPQAC